MNDTSRLSLPFIMAGQALKHITHNDALNRLDALVQPVVESTVLTSPPVTPLPGEAFLVPSGASDDWAGHGDEIAAWQDGAWRFYDPAEGWQVFDRASGTLQVFTGADWVAVAATGSGLPQLGINTSADGTNRLAVAAAATLLTHEGAGHQLKLNKASSGDTASLLFQSNWSGRAEMGLMGDDHWRIKVSPDGSGWTDAIAIHATTAAVSIAGVLGPASDNTLTLGTSGARWSAVWSATGTIQTSDRRHKIAVAPSALGLDFIQALEPVQFQWKGGDTSTHYGLIAQQVAEVTERLGVDFGGHVLADPTDPQSQQALRYDQFIAPLVAAVQALAERVETLEGHSQTPHP
ncbi:DUF2793 domain-containing protein [Devosia sp. XJ19-1]|uniref:DUF2793 domain-containing protein n=1 Tax=Devosia ureilytica TaxID=2952754 RepID=A0A9Q4ALT4_9HYPH|nr:DUF2793 domain-containing protein [Devosia ureilytica]MCP8883164.1 DUF2793 domain-containing protein [Devosia ureilytica]MCP8886468.1 DUF2793 domain-containing protein [Devosia ureilytica]